MGLPYSIVLYMFMIRHNVSYSDSVCLRLLNVSQRSKLLWFRLNSGSVTLRSLTCELSTLRNRVSLLSSTPVPSLVLRDS